MKHSVGTISIHECNLGCMHACCQVIAVVMDVFTDVDIFRDLLDAGFKRKVSVYILLERTTLPHFLSMCRRANMHAGHLKVNSIQVFVSKSNLEKPSERRRMVSCT